MICLHEKTLKSKLSSLTWCASCVVLHAYISDHHDRRKQSSFDSKMNFNAERSLSLRNIFPRLSGSHLKALARCTKTVAFLLQGGPVSSLIAEREAGQFREPRDQAQTCWTLSEARSGLYQRRILRPRPQFSAFIKFDILFFAFSQH